MLTSTIKEFANNWDLTKPLEASILEALSLDELEALKRVLILRAADILGEQLELTYKCEPFISYAKLRQFNAKRCDDELNPVMSYSVGRFANDNFFVPGPWFQKEIEKLDQLRKDRDENAASFPSRRRQSLINDLSGRGRGAHLSAKAQAKIGTRKARFAEHSRETEGF